MVLNLCEAHFLTTVHCNKPCADGYDVTNLLSGDSATRRRGLRLEYFLRPPLHVTLGFPVKMELCRVDVELWPWLLDQGKNSRRLEIFSSNHPNVGEFKLVGRCDLGDEVSVCFRHSAFKPRAPFLRPPAQTHAQTQMHAQTQTHAQARRVELWSRGPQSLDSVARLRVSIPYSGSGSHLGFKSLAVWAVPARCCSSSEVEKFHQIHQSLMITPPSAIPTPELPKPDDVPLDIPIPEEFLDPLTQNLMVFPMILPGGMVIDSSTLEEYEKREATWGRAPNDPFTGVPFTRNSKPLPNPSLKSRIDRMVLQMGCAKMESNLFLNKPRASRLIVTSPNVNDPKPSVSQPKIQDVSRDSSDSSGKRRFKRKYECSPSRAVETNGMTSHTTESHEQRLAHSLDEALDQALHGLPTFTSQSHVSSGEQKCVFCSCVLSVYSWGVLSYSLPCGHLMCGPCVQHKRPPDAQRLKVTCPECDTSASSGDITRVHH